MSAIAILVSLVIAGLAAFLWTIIHGEWNWRKSAAIFALCLAILFLPGFIRP